MLKKGLSKIMRWQSSNRQVALRERDSYIGSLLKDIGPELSSALKHYLVGNEEKKLDEVRQHLKEKERVIRLV